MNFAHLSVIEIALLAMHLLTTAYVLAAAVFAFKDKKPSQIAQFIQFALGGFFKPFTFSYMALLSVFSAWLWWYLDYTVVFQASLVYFAFLYAAYLPVVYVLLRRAQQRAYLDRVVPSL